jgi:hypothetical protein
MFDSEKGGGEGRVEILIKYVFGSRWEGRCVLRQIYLFIFKIFYLDNLCNSIKYFKKQILHNI